MLSPHTQTHTHTLTLPATSCRVSHWKLPCSIRRKSRSTVAAANKLSQPPTGQPVGQSNQNTLIGCWTSSRNGLVCNRSFRSIRTARVVFVSVRKKNFSPPVGARNISTAVINQTGRRQQDYLEQEAWNQAPLSLPLERDSSDTLCSAEEAS